MAPVFAREQKLDCLKQSSLLGYSGRKRRRRVCVLAISHGHATVLSEITCLISISAVHDPRSTIHDSLLMKHSPLALT
jgi:hypothetical protein